MTVPPIRSSSAAVSSAPGTPHHPMSPAPTTVSTSPVNGGGGGGGDGDGSGPAGRIGDPPPQAHTVASTKNDHVRRVMSRCDSRGLCRPSQTRAQTRGEPECRRICSLAGLFVASCSPAIAKPDRSRVLASGEQVSPEPRRHSSEAHCGEYNNSVGVSLTPVRRPATPAPRAFARCLRSKVPRGVYEKRVVRVLHLA